MSEVVPLPSFGEVFFDARGQERCLRVTWHEGTLVLSLWRGEMCTASFRMPMEDVGRLLDTLDEGFAEATGEQPAVPAHDPGTEVIPGTGQYQRPPQTAPQPLQQPLQQVQPHHQQPLDDRPAAALSPNDVLVARGPAPQDKLVASFGETTAPRDPAPAPSYNDRPLFTGPQYVDSTAPQPQYPGDPFSGPHYTGDPFSGPQYGSDAPQYQKPSDNTFGESQYGDGAAVYQMPGDQHRPSPLNTDPLGFPSQAADPYTAPQHRPEPYPADPYPADSYAADSYPADSYSADSFGRRQEAHAQHQQTQGGGAGLGTPMHGIPGAGRRRAAPQPQPVMDDYGAYQQPQQPGNPVDPLLSLGGRQEPQQYQPQQPPQDQGISRPYAGDPMFSTGERLRPDQPDYHQRSDRREW